MDANPKRIKKMRFQKYPDTCRRGLSDRFQPGNILKMIEHVCCSARPLLISLLTYLGSNSNVGHFFTHPVPFKNDFLNGQFHMKMSLYLIGRDFLV